MYRHISKHLVVSLLLVALLGVSSLWGINLVSAADIPDIEPLKPNWTEPPLSKFQETVESEVLAGETHLHWSTNTLINSLLTLIVGREQNSGETDSGGGDTYRSGGALGGVTALIAVMYANPPASGVEYLAYLGKNLGIVSPAYAQQGVGFGGLTPILPIWKAFRDVAYIFFVIIFIATGFAIMFRMKISPQAVMTIQSAIPRVVVALILVTFSYAIAGFLIDIMYVLLALGIAALGAPGLFTPDEVAAFQEQFISGGFAQVIGAVFKGLIDPLAWLGIGTLIGTAIGAIVGYVVGAVIGALAGGGVFILIIGITVLYVVVKLLFELLKTYISILMSIIFAPFQIMLGVLPGQSGFGSWMKGLFANLMVFPAVAMALLLGRLLIKGGAVGEGLWTPPMVGLGGLSANVLPGLIGLGFLLMLNKIPEMVKQAFDQKPMPYGAAIGAVIGAPFGSMRTWGAEPVSTLGKIRFAEPRPGEMVIPGVAAGTAARLSWPELIYRRLQGARGERGEAPGEAP